jgi:hypothetical protein
MNKKTKATHWVLAHGKDCDGHNSGHIYAFDNEEDANDCSQSLNASSDGLQYTATRFWADVEEYCYEYNKDPLNYKTIY